mmetsp:Transcript_42/g.136  ORF Transcript_42/g.136 Transcript_42/m.136 type:complete len:223 (-) Transcript_42:2997-3665(-)
MYLRRRSTLVASACCHSCESSAASDAKCAMFKNSNVTWPSTGTSRFGIRIIGRASGASVNGAVMCTTLRKPDNDEVRSNCGARRRSPIGRQSNTSTTTSAPLLKLCDLRKSGCLDDRFDFFRSEHSLSERHAVASLPSFIMSPPPPPQGHNVLASSTFFVSLSRRTMPKLSTIGIASSTLSSEVVGIWCTMIRSSKLALSVVDIVASSFVRELTEIQFFPNF